MIIASLDTFKKKYIYIYTFSLTQRLGGPPGVDSFFSSCVVLMESISFFLSTVVNVLGSISWYDTVIVDR